MQTAKADTLSAEFMAMLLLIAAVFIGLILQGGNPIPSGGNTCEHPCVVLQLPWDPQP